MENPYRTNSLLFSFEMSYRITPLKGAPRLRAQCTYKWGRAHAPLNRRKS